MPYDAEAVPIGAAFYLSLDPSIFVRAGGAPDLLGPSRQSLASRLATASACIARASPIKDSAFTYFSTMLSLLIAFNRNFQSNLASMKTATSVIEHGTKNNVAVIKDRS